MTSNYGEGVVPLAGTDEAVRTRPPGDGAASSSEAEGRSLFEDVQVLIEDGKTYLEAELNFQKTRASFAADRAKRVAIFGSAALVLAFLAAIGLTVGLIIALTPHLTAWGATALVVGALGALAAFAANKALRRGRELAMAFGSGREKKQ